MARFTGATVLLILIAAVSVYTCAVLAGVALGRTLESLERSSAEAVSSKLQLPFGISITIGAVSPKYFAANKRQREQQSSSSSSSSSSSWSSSVVPLKLSPVVSSSQSRRSASYHTPFFTPGVDPVVEQTPSVAVPRQQLRSRQHGNYGNGNFSGEIVVATKVGPWGGSGGQPFYMRTGGGGARLKSVTLYHSDAIHAFSYEYVSESGRRRAQGGGGGHPRSSKGAVRETIYLSPDEHITAIEGTFGRCRSVTQVVVTSLTFRTDKGRTHGPYGEPTGLPFSVPVANGCIVGFWGRSGWLLDAIGVYVAPCKVYKAAS